MARKQAKQADRTDAGPVRDDAQVVGMPARINLTPAAWRAFRHRLVDEGKTVADALGEAVRLWLTSEPDSPAARSARPDPHRPAGRPTRSGCRIASGPGRAGYAIPMP